MLDKIKKTWKNNGFEMVFVGCLILIGILAIFKIGEKGTWSNAYLYDKNMIASKKKTHSDWNNTDSLQPKKTSSGELECRRVLQKIFNKPFNTIRPDFLRNPVTGDNFNLELDCYDDSLKLGVEYQGQQHYKYIPYFHKNKEAFRNQCYRDELKRRMCRDNRINLIEVPHTIKVQNIEDYIRKELKIIGYIN